MPKKKLTDLFCEKVKPPAKDRIEYFDTVFPGLSLRVSDTGSKSFGVYYRLHKRHLRYTIGAWPGMKPALARREAEKALEQVRKGIDPSNEKRRQRQTKAVGQDTFEEVKDEWLAKSIERNNPKSHAEIKRIVDREFLPRWRKRPIGTLTRRDVIDAIDDIVTRDAPVMANRAHAWLNVLFGWAVEKDRLNVSPMAGLKKPSEETSRDRELTNDESRWLWSACDVLGYPFGPIVKLLLLTLQRRGEVALMEWCELDLEKRIWEIPKHKMKNGKAHIVHLSDAAVDVIKTLPHIGNGLIFSFRDEKAVTGFGTAKVRLDTAMLAARQKEQGPKAEPLAHWTLHDLRRTGATGMGKLKIAPHVVDKILAHSTGTISGVAGIYNKFEYLEEREAALNAWGRYIDELTTGTARGNLIALRA